MTVRLRHRCLCSALAMLERQVPALVRSPQIGDARGFSLRSLKSYAPALLTDDALRGIDEELARTPGAVARAEAPRPQPAPTDSAAALELHTIPLWETGAPAAKGDELVPAANAIAYYQTVHAAGVPVEMHVFERGRHGLGLAMGEQALGEWPMLLRNWMRQRGLLDPAGGG